MNPILKADIDALCQSKVIDWSRFDGKTVLITGANGMLGSYMAKALLACDAKVRVIACCRNKAKAETSFAESLDNPMLQIVLQDVTEPFAINEPVHFIIHAASQASPKYYGSDPVGTFLPNVLGTQQLMLLAQQNPIESMLFISSSEVYGQNQFECITENDYGLVDPLSVRSCYAEGKRAGETLCVSWHHQYDIPVKIVRPFHCYGPSMQLDDGRVYADFVAAIVRGEPIRLNSDGSAMRAFCYITDATEAFFVALLKGEDATAYNVANPDAEVSIRELAERLVAMFPEKNLSVEINAPKQDGKYLRSQVLRSTPSIDALESLGWKPSIAIDEGFRRTVEGLSCH